MSTAKLKIFATDEARGLKGPIFSCPINPETISHSRENQLSEENGADTAGGTNQHKSMVNQTMSFDIYFDGTGAVDGNTRDVDSQINSLLAVAYDYNGEEHRPNYLLVSYSGIKFYCQLQSLKTDYTLFSASGSALRAKVSLSFKEYIPDAEKQREARKSSPDMTHVKTVREGDSLLLMCREIYGKMDYYLQVAEINGLSNFRELEVGSQLVFPPLQK